MVWRGIETPSRLFLRGSVLSLCLLAFVVIDCRSAWATCGDHLHGQVSAKSTSMMLGDVKSPRENPSPQGPVCSGPKCRQHHPVPAAPGKAVQVPTANDAILAAIPSLNEATTCSFQPSTDADHVAGPVSRVFRPPRAA
jgi:hypothetical protein